MKLLIALSTGDGENIVKNHAGAGLPVRVYKPAQELHFFRGQGLHT